MNKYAILIIVLVLLLLAGGGYRFFFTASEKPPAVRGVVKEIVITAKKNQWRWEPDTVEAVEGDRVRITVVNEDDYDHGIAIDSFGISQRVPANSRITAEFVATKPGTFPFYCSVPCGEGIVDGVKRGHFDQVGRLQVRSLISETR